MLGPHLCAAAAELPLKPEEREHVRADGGWPAGFRWWTQGYLRRRPAGWFWTHAESAASMVNLRAAGGGPINIVEAETGTLLGTMDGAQSQYQAHTGAVYVHQGQTFLVEELNEADHCAVVTRANPEFYTQARDITQIEVMETERSEQWGEVQMCFGTVKVTTQVVSFQRKALVSNEILGEEPLELEAKELFTKAVWFIIDEKLLLGAGLAAADFPGFAARGRACLDRDAARWWQPPTAGTSAASPPPCTLTPASRPSSCTTVIPAVPVSRSGPTKLPRSGSAPPGMPSGPASATAAARPACSPPSAATRTIPWTRRAPSP